MPWVCRLSRRGARSQCSSPPSVSRSTASPARWPPLISTQRGPYSSTAAAARRRSVSVSTRTPVSWATSSRLGVATVATGSSLVRTESSAEAASSASPCLETPTGSTTAGASVPAINSATVSTSSAEDSIPVLTAWTPMSSTTLRYWARTASTGSSQAPCTPSEFCAVTAVSTLMPWVPRASIVLRSAWMPAPPPESEPATVRTFGRSVPRSPLMPRSLLMPRSPLMPRPPRRSGPSRPCWSRAPRRRSPGAARRG